jgi:Zn-finger domain-containing protein
MATRFSDAGLPVDVGARVTTVSENLYNLQAVLRDIENNVDASYNAIHGTVSPTSDAAEGAAGIRHHLDSIIDLATRIRQTTERVRYSLEDAKVPR